MGQTHTSFPGCLPDDTREIPIMKQGPFIQVVASLLATLAVLVLFLAGEFHTPPVHAQTQSAATSVPALPPEIFSVGKRIHGLNATYYVEEVRGGWIKARLYRTLDKNPAPPSQSRWIYVPAAPGPWTLAKGK